MKEKNPTQKYNRYQQCCVAVRGKLLWSNSVALELHLWSNSVWQKIGIAVAQRRTVKNFSHWKTTRLLWTNEIHSAKLRRGFFEPSKVLWGYAQPTFRTSPCPQRPHWPYSCGPFQCGWQLLHHMRARQDSQALEPAQGVARSSSIQLRWWMPQHTRTSEVAMYLCSAGLFASPACLHFANYGLAENYLLLISPTCCHYFHPHCLHLNPFGIRVFHIPVFCFWFIFAWFLDCRGCPSRHTLGMGRKFMT